VLGFQVRRFFFLVLAALLFSAGLYPLVVSAKEDASMEAAAHEQLVAKTEMYLSLLPKAQANGTLRVIVRLALPFTPESLHGDFSSIHEQQARIWQAQETVLRAMSASSARTARIYRYVPYLAMEVDGTALWDLIVNPIVASVREDVPVPTTLDQSVPLIGALEAWELGYSGQGQSIAILDTGVDADHPFLAGKVVAEACFSTTYDGLGSTSVCPNGQEEQEGPGSASICSVGGCDHGTHMAGIAAGEGEAFSGVAPDATILAVQIFSRFGPDQCRSYGYSGDCVLSYPSDQISALEWVYEQRHTHNIAAANFSLGGGRYTTGCDSDPRKPIIDTLLAAGIATVVSSGNDSFVNALAMPSCISSTISVGSTTISDSISEFSNVSPYLDLLAPGTGIISAVPGGGFESWEGTSLSAPHVAGAWAVLKSLHPDAGVEEVLASLAGTGLQITDARPGGVVTIPRIRLDLALLDLQANRQATATPTATATATTAPSATATSTLTATATESPEPTATSTETVTATATITPTTQASETPSPTPQEPTPTPTPTPDAPGDTRWYLAEGYSGAGAETFILVQNPNPESASVFVTYQLQDGAEIVRQHLVAPESRYTIAAHAAGEVGQGEAFSTLVESDLPVIVERAMYFSSGGHNSAGARMPSTIWYLAEGYTGNAFSTYILVQNPNDLPATVAVHYLLEQGESIRRVHSVGAQRRYTIVAGVDDEVGPDQAFSVVVYTDLPVIVERSMYFPLGGHNTFGVPYPNETWYLAEGSTRPGFETFILIQNPQQTEANLDITYMTQDGGTVTTQHLVAPMSRYTVSAGTPAEVGPDVEFSTLITSDVPVVVERAMYFETGGHCSVGVTSASTEWYLAEGYTGEGFVTHLAVQNPNSTQASVVISYLKDDGERVLREHVIPATSRYTVNVGELEELGPEAAFSVRLVSDLPVVVERAMYFASGGHVSPGMMSED
jgi:subtilisin family serine protease